MMALQHPLAMLTRFQRLGHVAWTAAGHALGGIFYIPRAWLGLLLWLALAQHPQSVGFALLGLAIGHLVERTLHIHESAGQGGGIKANALLSAVVTGWLTSSIAIDTVARIGLAAASAIVAALIAAALMRILAKSLLPPLLWSYCIVAAMLFSVCPTCTVLAAQALPLWPVPQDMAGWIESFLRSMGSLLYAPQWLAGLAVCLAIVLWSRASFLAGLVGWVSGISVALVFQRMGLSYVWLPVSYNFFITGMALGSVIFLPGRNGLLVAAAGGCVTAFFAMVLQYWLQWSATSYLPISSALAIWVGMGALTLAGERTIALQSVLADMPPESKWWHVSYWNSRFGKPVPLFALPVAGTLQVTQGFGGALSHQGMYRHALDFQRPRKEDPAAGLQLSLWGSVVTSPVTGTVERTRNHVKDNAVGYCNNDQKWGNYVVIHLDEGGWALLAHLQQGSVVVAPGARVATGSYLGLVGNSGRSPVPHLHLQLQDAPEPGSATTAFRLANYQTAFPLDGPLLLWHASSVPLQDDVVVAAPSNDAVHSLLSGLIAGTAVWSLHLQGLLPLHYAGMQHGTTLTVQVRLDEFGRHVFTSEGGARLVCRLDTDAWRVVEISPSGNTFFELLGLAVPSIPFASQPGMVWNDIAPLQPAGRWRGLQLLVAPYRRRPFTRSFCKCAATPSGEARALVIKSRIAYARRNHPQDVSCEFAALRGPVQLNAQFARGSVRFSMLSFDPLLPDNTR